MSKAGIYRSQAGEEEVMNLYTRALAQWPVPFAAREVATRHGATFVIESGPVGAPSVVLLHGTMSNALSWMGDVGAYAPHFRVLAVDVPGEPGRSAAVRPDHQGPAFAEWMADVLDGLGVVSTSLLGLSKGGMIALKFATMHPDRVERLVLLAPSGIAPVRPSFLVRAILLSCSGAKGRQRINRITLGRETVDPSAVEFMRVMMAHVRPEIVKGFLCSDDDLRRLTMPVLLMAGEDDALMDTPKMVGRMKALLPGATVTSLPGRGHALLGLTEEIVPFLLGAAAAG